MNDEPKKKINLGGFPNLLLTDDSFKKKRETSQIINDNKSNIKQINILNIKDILRKKK
jgi:hypothetical protein